MGILLLILMVGGIFFGGGFLLGYFVGRSAGQRQPQQGFPVLPAAPTRLSPPQQGQQPVDP